MVIGLLLACIAQVVLFVLNLKKKDGTYVLSIFILEVGSIIASGVMQNYYKSLPPNDNWMPGLSYLGEIIFSGVLGVWSIVNLVVTIITVLMIKRKNA